MSSPDLAPRAAALAPRSPEMVGEMMRMLQEQIEELHGDEQVIARLRASVESNVSTLLHLLEQPMDLQLLSPPAGAVQWSLQLAQRGIPLSVLWRAYHLCAARFLAVCIEELTRRSDSVTELGRAITSASMLINSYIDHVCELIGASYDAERQSWLRQQDAVRAERIADLLAGRIGDRREAEAALGYGLGGRHLGVVLWDGGMTADGSGSLRLQRLTTRWAGQLGCRDQPLIVARDRSNVWAWLPVPLPVRAGTDYAATLTGLLEGAGGLLRGAVGEVGTGVDGFARAHRQAVAAQSVALAAGPCAARVTPYEEVAGLSFLCENPARAREWVHETLGPLAADDEAHARLRESVGAFLDTGGSLTAAAERLGCHKNTVQYRIRRAEEALGRTVRERRIDLELALKACRWLGTAVLRPPTG